MNKSEKIVLIKGKKFREQGGKCASCGKPFKTGDIIELAHIVPQRKWCVKKWGHDAIHHERNMVLTHTGICNSRAQINPDSVQADELMKSILREIKDERI